MSLCPDIDGDFQKLLALAKLTAQSVDVVRLTQITFENSSLAWFNMQPTGQIWSAGSSVWPEPPFLWKFQGASCCLIPMKETEGGCFLPMLLRGGQEQHPDTDELLLCFCLNELLLIVNGLSLNWDLTHAASGACLSY